MSATRARGIDTAGSRDSGAWRDPQFVKIGRPASCRRSDPRSPGAITEVAGPSAAGVLERRYMFSEGS
jgi:hypothetical protein